MKIDDMIKEVHTTVFTYPYTAIVSNEIDFGVYSTIVRDFRETKLHFIDGKGEKFSKKTGYSLSGYKYKGYFFGEVLILSSIKPKCN